MGYAFYGVKSVRIRSYSGPYFFAFGLNTDQNNSEYGHFSRSVIYLKSWFFDRWYDYSSIENKILAKKSFFVDFREEPWNLVNHIHVILETNLIQI